MIGVVDLSGKRVHVDRFQLNAGTRTGAKVDLKGKLIMRIFYLFIEQINCHLVNRVLNIVFFYFRWIRVPFVITCCSRKCCASHN